MSEPARFGTIRVAPESPPLAPNSLVYAPWCTSQVAALESYQRHPCCDPYVCHETPRWVAFDGMRCSVCSSVLDSAYFWTTEFKP